MMNRVIGRRGWVIALALVAGAGSAFETMAGGPGNPNPGVTVAPESGQYAKLSAEWWRWAFAQPTTTSPLFHATDPTGALAANGQPTRGNVFFLGGLVSLNSGLEATAERTVVIPTGTRLFFPILNSEADFPTSATGATTVQGLRAEAAFFADQVITLHATLDGKRLRDLTAYRAASPEFGYTLPDRDNFLQFFGVDIAGTVSPAVGDGYYLLLEPLTRGRHTLTFGGTTHTLDANNNPVVFSLDITYHVTVVPGREGW
jgi:hypothetical protein